MTNQNHCQAHFAAKCRRVPSKSDSQAFLGGNSPRNHPAVDGVTQKKPPSGPDIKSWFT
jgi:hypothetical protein